VIDVWSNQVHYLAQAANGQWSSPQVVWTSIWVDYMVLTPRLVIQPNNTPRIIVSDPDAARVCTQNMGGSWDWAFLASPPSVFRLTVDVTGRSHFLAWGSSWWAPPAVYGREIAGLEYATDGLSDYAGNGDLAIDQQGIAYIVNIADGALWLRYKMPDAAWSMPRYVAAGAIGIPRLIADSNGGLNIVYLTENNLIYRRMLPPGTLASATIKQSISLPADMPRATLAVLYQLQGSRLDHTGQLVVKIQDEMRVTPVFTSTTDQAIWTQQWMDLTRWTGQTVTLALTLENSTYPSAAQLWLDEISLGSWLTPDPQAIEPVHITTPTTQVITITGDNFFATPQVRLNDVPLSDVTWINTTTLTATVPVLPFGRYDLIVTNPGGQASGLPRALLVGYEVLLPIVRK
jgi:hypothetical protein